MSVDREALFFANDEGKALARVESSAYQAILEEGRLLAYQEAYLEGFLIGVKESLLLVGVEMFCPPNPEIRERIEGVLSMERWEFFALKFLRASSWEEWLA